MTKFADAAAEAGTPTEKRKTPRKPRPQPVEVQAIIDQIAALPSLDGLYAKAPSKMKRADRRALIEHHRKERALYEAKARIAADKKEEKANG